MDGENIFDESDDMPVIGLRLSVNQEKAARLLAEGRTQTAAAKAIGVTKQTMHRWLKDPLMQRRVNELRLDVVKQADEVLTMSIPDAATTVAKIASGRADFADVKELTPRLRAAFYILDRVFKAKLPKPTKGQREATENDEADDPALGMDDEDIKNILEKALGK